MPMPSNIVTSTPKLDLSGYGMSMVPKTPTTPTYGSNQALVTGNKNLSTTAPAGYGANQSMVASLQKPAPQSTQSLVTGNLIPQNSSKGLVSIPGSSSALGGSNTASAQSYTPGVYGTPYQPPAQASQQYQPPQQSYQPPMNQITTGAQYNTAVNGASNVGNAPVNYTGDTNQPNYNQPVQSPPFSGDSQASSFPGLVSSLYGAGSSNFTTGQQAADIAADYGKRIADVGQQGAIGEGSRLTTGTTPVAQGGAAVIAQTTAAQQTALAKGEEAALQGTSQQLTGNAQAANAFNQAGQLAQPVGNTPYFGNPLTGGVVGGQGNAQNAIINAGNLKTVSDFTQKYNAGKANLQAAQSIENQIVNTINSNSLNSTPLSAIANLNELLSGQISSGPQQLLSQQIASYINQLGLDPASVTKIASQQQGTLAQLLDSLKTTATAQNEAYNPANINTNGGQTGQTSGNTYKGYTLPY